MEEEEDGKGVDFGVNMALRRSLASEEECCFF